MARTPGKSSKRCADEMSQHVCRRVRELRTARGWSLDTLSKASDVSRSMLSQIEREQANPTLAVTYRIAQAFGISLGELAETTGGGPGIEVVRADDRAHYFRSDKHCTIRTLSPLRLEKDVEFYEVILKPGGVLRSAPHFEGTREFLTVQKGRVEVVSGDDKQELHRGDSAGYRADVPHSVSNAGRGAAHLFLVVIYD